MYAESNGTDGWLCSHFEGTPPHQETADVQFCTYAAYSRESEGHGALLKEGLGLTLACSKKTYVHPSFLSPLAPIVVVVARVWGVCSREPRGLEPRTATCRSVTTCPRFNLLTSPLYEAHVLLMPYSWPRESIAVATARPCDLMLGKWQAESFALSTRAIDVNAPGSSRLACA